MAVITKIGYNWKSLLEMLIIDNYHFNFDLLKITSKMANYRVLPSKLIITVSGQGKSSITHN